MSSSSTWRRTVLGLTWATSLVFVSMLSSRAQPPPPVGRAQLTVQARLTTAQQQPVSGQLALTFHVMDAPAGGTPLWSETHDGTVLPRVTAANGLISVALGQAVPLDAAIFAPSTGGDRYVAIELGGAEVARVKLTATAYSIVASVANAVWDPATSTSLDVSALDARYVQTSGAGGGVLRTINGVAPTGAGDFSISAAPTGRVVVTQTPNGVELDAAALDEATTDARYVNVAGDTVTGDLAVAGALSAATTHAQNATVADQLTARVLRASVLQFDAGNSGRMESDNGTFNFLGSHANASFNLAQTSIAHFAFNGNTTVLGRLEVSATLAANGGLIVPTGQLKAFYHDLGDGTAIYYCSLEGPESTNFVRGEGRLSGGVAVIDLPDHFGVVTLDGEVTAHVTPLGPNAGLYVQRASNRQLEVRENAGGAGDARFNYLVLGVRIGHAGEQPIRPAPGR